jgi:hypothetical protein
MEVTATLVSEYFLLDAALLLLEQHLWWNAANMGSYQLRQPPQYHHQFHNLLSHLANPPQSQNPVHQAQTLQNPINHLPRLPYSSIRSLATTPPHTQTTQSTRYAKSRRT